MNDIKTAMAYDLGLDKAKKMTIEDIKNNAGDIEAIKFSKSLIRKGTKILYTTKENPYTYTYPANFDRGYPMKCLHIDEEYYIENKQEVKELISFIAKQQINKLKILDIPLITEELINIILSNHNLEEVTLGNKSAPFTLDVNLYNKFKNSNIKRINTDNVVDDLKTILDGLIGYNYNGNLVGKYSFYELIERDSISFDEPLSEQELNYLKYINEDCEIKIFNDAEQHVVDIIKKLKENKKNNLIRMYLYDNDCFNKLLFENYELFLSMNIMVFVDSIEMDIKTYASCESRLIKMIEPALNLSPFEKYLFAYNIVKKYKKYKEEPKGKNQESRNVYKILDNDYMVCAGYSALLQNLLNKLGINNRYYGVDVDITFDEVPIDAHVVTEEMLTPYEDGGHARVQVHLVDPKYGINGIFIVDPTWDNEMENDAYNHALMTPDEYNGIKRHNYLSWDNIDELFFVHSLEEFYEKANLWMNKYNERDPFKLGESVFINMFMNVLEILSPSFYQKLCYKYPTIVDYYGKLIKEELSSVIFDLGNYIVSKVNKPVTGLQFKQAIEVLYENCYGIKDKEELNKKIDEIMEYNKDRHAEKFPLRYKQDLEGNNIPYMNITNKFDIDSTEIDLGRSI